MPDCVRVALDLPLPGIPTTKKKNDRSRKEMRQHGSHLRIREDAVGIFSAVLAGAGSERVLEDPECALLSA